MTNQTAIAQLANEVLQLLGQSELSLYEKHKVLALAGTSLLWSSDSILLTPRTLESSLDSQESPSEEDVD